ncbi:hypothetical protein MKW98_004882 [Papaver atlanticum]|uniref:Secreted protein n=1 Tax=Papaver atlanticum TaxID=357466 RepID=A0AAD4RY63_9MAGN|nr:hypothetical protein MKW98_004882 [Papaver atlanticum]
MFPFFLFGFLCCCFADNAVGDPAVLWWIVYQMDKEAGSRVSQEKGCFTEEPVDRSKRWGDLEDKVEREEEDEDIPG